MSGRATDIMIDIKYCEFHFHSTPWVVPPSGKGKGDGTTMSHRVPEDDDGDGEGKGQGKGKGPQDADGDGEGMVNCCAACHQDAYGDGQGMAEAMAQAMGPWGYGKGPPDAGGSKGKGPAVGKAKAPPPVLKAGFPTIQEINEAVDGLN